MSKKFRFNEIAVGCDAEGFWLNKKGKPVSVEGKLGGMKGTPLLCDGGGYLEDCVAFEINPEPVPISVGADGFVTNIRKCLSAVDIEANKLGFTTSLTPVQLFASSQLESDQAKVSGCSDSYDAWDLKRLVPINLEATFYRFASGDIHVSWPDVEDHPYFRINVARWLDALVGLTEVVHTRSNRRKDHYGRAGTHRPTDYGVEWKSGGNFWLTTDARIKWVYKQATLAVERATKDINGGKELSLDHYKAHIKSCRVKWDKITSKAILQDLSVDSFPV